MAACLAFCAAAQLLACGKSGAAAAEALLFAGNRHRRRARDRSSDRAHMALPEIGIRASRYQRLANEVAGGAVEIARRDGAMAAEAGESTRRCCVAAAARLFGAVSYSAAKMSVCSRCCAAHYVVVREEPYMA